MRKRPLGPMVGSPVTIRLKAGWIRMDNVAPRSVRLHLCNGIIRHACPTKLDDWPHGTIGGLSKEVAKRLGLHTILGR